MRKITLTAIIGVAIVATSCSGVGKCRAPELDMPAEIAAGQTDSTTIADIEWWRFYGDEHLSKLIEKALDHNRELLGAASRVERMKALHGLAKANQLPQINYQIAADNETNDYYNKKSTSDAEFDLKATISWEADFWGRLKWSKRKSMADYLGSVEAARSMRMIVIAEVADAYFRLAALDNEISIVRRTLATREESMRLAKLRFEGGLTSETVYQQSKVEYATTATLVPSLERQIETTKNEIALLTGEFPGGEMERNSINTEIYLPDSLSVGVSSTLLKRRPDVLQAESALRSAMAEVGLTYADRFPRITFTLTGGVENDELSTLLKSPFSYILGSVTGPLFDFGRRKRNYQASLAAYDEARHAYEQKVLEVFKETSDAIKTYSEARKTTKLRTQLRDAAGKYVSLANTQYRGGSIAYIDVLDAQRRYFDAQIGLSNAVRDEHLALVWLYKALGGGV